MVVIDGQLPEGIEWRVLLALEVGQKPGIALRMGNALARAYRGDLVIALLISPVDSQQVRAAAFNEAASYRQRQVGNNGADIFVVVIETGDVPASLRELVKKADIDLLMMLANRPKLYDFRHFPCAVALIRQTESPTSEIDGHSLERVLIPTSGGPNSSYALGLMLPLAPETEATALYVAVEGRGDNEEALGRARLNQVLDFVHAGEKIRSRLAVHESVSAGIIEEAAQDYDLVLIGATEESRLDQALFGNIPAAVVERTEKPVMILRQKSNAVANVLTALDWRLHTVFPQKSISERAEIYARIRRDARPKTQFFVLIALSAMIAALGLIVNSPAVVIGAMLVAPLMSPIIGTGLAIVLGDARFLRLALGAVNRGVLLAIFIGVLAGLTALNRPFSNEILSRTQPNLFDLGIALFSGAAAAYALSFSQAAGALPGVAIAAALVPPLATVGITLVAGLAALLTGQTADGLEYLTDSLGALLLFTTNFIAISTAAALVFFFLGFRPTPSKKARREVQRRSSVLALSLLIVVTLILGLTSFILARESATEGRIYTITEEQVTEILGAQLDSLEIVQRQEGLLNLSLTVISPQPVPHSQVVELQQVLAEQFIDLGIAEEFALTLSVIRVTQLDPLNPPTPTPDPSAITVPSSP